MPPEPLPEPTGASTPTRARAQSLQSEKPRANADGWVHVMGTGGGREGGQAGAGEGGRKNNEPKTAALNGRLRRRRNLNVSFDCPEPPQLLPPPAPWPKPTTPYLVADGLKLRTVIPEPPPRIHHT